MLYYVADIIEYISAIITLEPGDIISTGTISGVGATTGTFLQPGDRVEIEISRIGSAEEQRGRQQEVSGRPTGVFEPGSRGTVEPAFVVLCGLSFLGGFATAPYHSLLPVYVDADLGRLAVFTGYLRAVALALGGICAIVAGRLCDLLGLKVTLLLGLAGSAVTGLVFHTGDVLLLTLLTLVAGAASGPVSTSGQSYLIASAGPARLGLGGAL